MKKSRLKNKVLIVLALVAATFFLIGEAAVDNSTAEAGVLMAISGAFLVVFFAANNWGDNM